MKGYKGGSLGVADLIKSSLLKAVAADCETAPPPNQCWLQSTKEKERTFSSAGSYESPSNCLC